MIKELLENLSKVALAITIAFLVGGFTGLTPAAAQDEIVCESPGIDVEASPEAVADMMASPEAMDDAMASPEAIASEGEEADPALFAQVVGFFENYAACYNEGQASGDPGVYVGLESDNYVGEVTDGGDVEERIANESNDAPWTVELVSVENVRVHLDGRLSADVSLVFNEHMYVELRVFLDRDESLTWKYDAETFLSPQPDVGAQSVIGVTVGDLTDEATGETEQGVSFNLDSHPVIESLVLNITNATDSPVGTGLLAVDEGATPEDVLSGDAASKQVGFTGDIAPGETMDLVSLNLEPGTYMLVVFAEAGDPLVGVFTITDPEA